MDLAPRAGIVFLLFLLTQPSLGAEVLYRLTPQPIEPAQLSLAEIRAVAIDPRLEILVGDRPSLTLPLPGDARLEAVSSGAPRFGPRGAEERGASPVTWYGRIPRAGGVDGSVTLTVHKGLLSGAIFTPDGTWILRPLADRSHLLAEIDPERFPGCGLPSTGESPELLSGARDPVRGLDPPVIDVLALYTGGALQGAGGVAQIEGLILNAAAVTNSAFATSGVAATLDVVELAEIDLSQFPPLNSLEDALLALQADAGIAALREAAEADLVAAIFETGDGLCGFAHAMDEVGLAFESEAFSITVRGCAVANLSFPHEIAHNLGCRHNPEDSDATPQTASFPWSFGHSVSGAFRTIMALPTPCGAQGCNRAPNFSNPEVLVSGIPSGITSGRDNHRTLNATAPVAAAFRLHGLIFRDGFESGDPAGWTSHAPGGRR